MTRKIKINWYFVIGLLVLAFLFYWYELRPNTIRRNCEWSVFSKETAEYVGEDSVIQNNKYRQCLIKNGLKPESIFVNTQ